MPHPMTGAEVDELIRAKYDLQRYLDRRGLLWWALPGCRRRKHAALKAAQRPLGRGSSWYEHVDKDPELRRVLEGFEDLYKRVWNSRAPFAG